MFLRKLSLFLILACFVPPAFAQCTGDCDGSGEVTVDEIVLGVNIALGTAATSACPVFDRNHDGSVTVDEIIVAVNYALSSCPATTPVPSPTPTPTQPAIVTATIPAGCGNGTVDFGLGETCDDGNNVDDDGPHAVSPCPANCRVAKCLASGNTIVASVQVSVPGGSELAGATVFVRYPDGVAGIPGAGSDDSVQARISDLPGNAFAVANDLDFALRLVVISTDQTALSVDPLFSVDFDICQSATTPASRDFTCIVEDAADTNLDSIAGATCTIVLH